MTTAMPNIILYPCDYFDHSIADDMFETERQIAIEMGFDVALFDYDSGRLLSVSSEIDDEFDCEEKKNRYAIYRGWHSSSPGFYDDVVCPLLANLGTPLTSPDEYDLARDYERYEPYLRPLLPPSITENGDEAMHDDFISSVFDELGSPVFVKDSVKSVYGLNRIGAEQSDDEIIAFLEDIRDSRGSSFSGYYTFKKWREYSEQVRFFVLDGKVVTAVAHGGEWSGTVSEKIPTDLPCRFYTVDMGYDSISKKWDVVECGDGQESDCEERFAMTDMYMALSQI